MADKAESSDSKGAKKDFSTAILECKKAANWIVVDDAINDNNSVVALHSETMEKLQLFRGNTFLIKDCFWIGRCRLARGLLICSWHVVTKDSKTF